MKKTALKLRRGGLSVKGNSIFKSLDLTLEEGGVLLITGPSGSGKSSFFRMLLGLACEDEGWESSGELFLSSRPGWVSQNPTWDLMGNWVKEEAGMKELQMLGAGDLYERRCTELSHGEKTITALAGAFSKDILLLDEPGVCLSKENRSALDSLLKKTGKTALIIDHTPEFLDTADRFLSFDRDPPSEVSREEAAGYLERIPDYCRPEPEGTGLLEVRGDLELSLPGGSCVGVSGDNGSGKTSLLASIAGVSSAADIKCSWMGRPLRGIRKRRGIVSYVPQEPGRFFLARTAGEQAGAWGIPEDILTRFGLSGGMDRPVETLSAGEKQRLAIAGAFSAPVMVLDEPTYGLDAASMEILFEGVREKCSGGGIVFISSHDRRILERLATCGVNLVA